MNTDRYSLSRMMSIQIQFLSLVLVLLTSHHVWAFQGFTAYPRSCKEILSRDKDAKSGLYMLTTSKGVLTVYCEMKIGHGGYTFLPRYAASLLTDGDLENLFTDRSSVLLRIIRKDGTQPYTVLKQLSKFKQHPISVQLSRYSAYRPPTNKHLGSYLYLGLVPANVAKSKSVQGFNANGHDITFKNCDGNPNSYFAFFENEDEKSPSSYHSSNLVYERSGVAVAWRHKAKPVYSLRNLPNDFHFFTEIHHGGCGTYTSSDRWREAVGAAIGVR